MPNAGGGGGGEWGTITGTLSAQTDLQAALNNKAALSHTHTKANITDFAHTHVRADITDFAHTHLWADITDKPLTFTPSAHTHTKANITDFAHTHVRSDITDFAHTHLWADISDKPLTFTPSAHTHTKANITDFAHTHLWVDITDKPSTFAPSTHTHLWADITDKPVTFAPSAHSHAWGTLTGTLSSQTDLQSALDAKAGTVHTHAATDITSGTLGIARGGTGSTTVPTNGQLLIGNGTGYAVANVTAGTGITVTNGVGTITIASTITPGSAVWGSITGTLSSQTDLNSALAGKANTTHTHLWADITDKPSTFTPTAHNHAATEITSGLLPIARGGTNIGTTPTNGQLLIGNGTGYAVANITAGSGITVTNGAGTITIASSALSTAFQTNGAGKTYWGPGTPTPTISLTGSSTEVDNYILGINPFNLSGANSNFSRNFFAAGSSVTHANSGADQGSIKESAFIANGAIKFNFDSTIEVLENCFFASTDDTQLNLSGISGGYIKQGFSIGSLSSSFTAPNSIVQASGAIASSLPTFTSAPGASISTSLITASTSSSINTSSSGVPSSSSVILASNNTQLIGSSMTAAIGASRVILHSSSIGTVFLGNASGRTVDLTLPNTANQVVIGTGFINILPTTSATAPTIRFSQRVPTANTTMPSPHYSLTLSVNDSALTSNVTFQLPSSNGSSGQFLTTNGSGVTSWANVSLAEVALSQNTASPNNTINATRILANAVAADADLVLQPKGTGALLAQLPDGTATGGNKRGTQSVDLQLSRTLNTEVAQGNYCGIVGGQRNTASGNYTFIAAGFLNNTSGSNQLVTGNGNAGSGNYSLITGGGNVCNGAFGFVIGSNNNLSSGSYITTIGQNNSSVQGDYAFVVGSSNSTGSSGSNVVIFGNSIGSNAGVTNVLAIGSSGTIQANSKTKIAVITGALACGTDYQSLTTDLTGASWSSLSSNAITMVNGQLMHYEINVVAVRGTDLAAYKITGVAFASGGSITLYNNVSTVVTEQGSATSWDARVSSSGLNLLIQGFGDVSGAVRWGATAIFTSSRT